MKQGLSKQLHEAATRTKDAESAQLLSNQDSRALEIGTLLLTKGYQYMDTLYPFVSVWLNDRVKILVVLDTIPRAATDGVNVWVNAYHLCEVAYGVSPENIMDLSPDLQRLPVKGIVYAMRVLMHECNHVADRDVKIHKRFIERGVGPDGTSYDGDLMNRAADYYNNSKIADITAGEVDEDGDYIPIHPSWLLDRDLWWDKWSSAEAIYCHLKRKNDEQEQASDSAGQGQDGQDGQNGQNGQEVMDEHVIPEDNSEQIADYEMEATLKKAHRIAQDAHGNRGSGIYDRANESMKEKAKIFWGDILREQLMGSVGVGDQSMEYPNEEYMSRVIQDKVFGAAGMKDIIFIPGEITMQAPHIVFLADVSVSITQEEKAIATGVLAELCREVNPKGITVYFTDTKVVETREIDIDNPDELTTMDWPRGGATDLLNAVPVIEEAMQGEEYVLIIFTDGLTDGQDRNRYPSIARTIWVTTRSQHKLQHGTVIKMED